MKRTTFLVALLFLGTVFSGGAGIAFAAEEADAQATVDKAELAFKSFMADENFAEMRKLVKKAKGILIAPQVLKGALVVGASGGTGVFLVRGAGKWSPPAFYTIGSMSLGLQVGGQASEVILLAMTDKGVETLLEDSVKLGADIGMAAGPYGGGVQAATANAADLSADVLAFSRSKGLYGGVSLDGAVVKVRDKLNESYYGKGATPEKILVKRSASNGGANRLRSQVAKLAGGK